MIFRDNLLFPFIGLLIGTGIYLTYRHGFLQIRFFFLGLKILSGSMDQKGGKGKITPFQAFTTGTASSLFPGAFIGSSIAFGIAGPGILPWIWLTSIIIMPVYYATSTFAIRYRQIAEDGTILSGPPLFIEKALKARWMSYLHGGLFIATALIFGAAFLAGIFFHNVRSIGIPPFTLSIASSIILILFMLGGIRRISWVARRLFVAGLFLLIIALYALFHTYKPHGAIISPDTSIFVDFFRAIVADTIPAGKANLKNMIIGLGIYHVLTEAGTGKLSGISGSVRTDYPAKQGLAGMLAPFFQGIFFSTISIFIIFISEKFETSTITSSYDFFSLHREDSFRIFYYLLFGSFAFFITAGLGGWFFSGYQAARYLGGHRSGIAFQILFLIIIFLSGLFLQMKSDAMEILYSTAVSISMMTSFFLLPALLMLWKTGNFELRRYLDNGHLHYEISKDFYLLILSAIPQNLVSRIFGWISYMHLPSFIMIPVLQAYSRVFKIDVNEAEKNIREYPSLNRFFTRALKEGARIVDKEKTSIISPVDGTVSRYGDVKSGKMIQAKGIDYSLSDLLESSKYLENFREGKYVVIYLSPRDYHRIHSPVEGKILGYTYTPGKLFAVNEIAVKGLHGLFPKNERLTTYIKNSSGMVGLVKVGAVNVGRIRVNYDTIHTNRWIRIARHESYDVPFGVSKGDEVGRFEMGSTVILLFEKGTVNFSQNIQEGRSIKFGQVIGHYKKTAVKRSSGAKKKPAPSEKKKSKKSIKKKPSR